MADNNGKEKKERKRYSKDFINEVLLKFSKMDKRNVSEFEKSSRVKRTTLEGWISRARVWNNSSNNYAKSCDDSRPICVIEKVNSLSSDEIFFIPYSQNDAFNKVYSLYEKIGTEEEPGTVYKRLSRIIPVLRKRLDFWEVLSQEHELTADYMTEDQYKILVMLLYIADEGDDVVSRWLKDGLDNFYLQEFEYLYTLIRDRINESFGYIGDKNTKMSAEVYDFLSLLDIYWDYDGLALFDKIMNSLMRIRVYNRVLNDGVNYNTILVKDLRSNGYYIKNNEETEKVDLKDTTYNICDKFESSKVLSIAEWDIIAMEGNARKKVVEKISSILKLAIEIFNDENAQQFETDHSSYTEDYRRRDRICASFLRDNPREAAEIVAPFKMKVEEAAKIIENIYLYWK